MLKSITTTFLLAIVLISCGKKTKSASEETEGENVTIEMVTTQGTITIQLSNETPKHRDNFVKLVNDAAYDSLLFHRVIENFMVQAGDPDSRNATASDTLGSGSLDYTTDAEFTPTLFHKKGALGAARDGNLARASGAMQFYMVQGKVLNDSLIDHNQNRINDWLAEHYFKNDVENKPLVDSLQSAIDNKNREKYVLFNDSIKNMAKLYENFERYTIPDAHREVYKTIGGTPHLDQNYTVFGEVTNGLDIIDKIAGVETNALDRPV